MVGAMRTRRVQEMVDSYRERGARMGSGRSCLPHGELLDRLRRFGRICRGEAFAGFKSLEQELVVYRVLEGEDVLAVMPTGSGKSPIWSAICNKPSAPSAPLRGYPFTGSSRDRVVA
jgi:superfamily II DNA or RNA helicase